MNLDLQDSNDEPTDFDQPDAAPTDQPEDRPARGRSIPADALQQIIDHHRAEFDQRDFDFGPLRDNRRLVRGSPEHAAAWGRRRPQWFAHSAHITAKGRRTSYLDLMRAEARERYGPDGAAAIEDLL